MNKTLCFVLLTLSSTTFGGTEYLIKFKPGQLNKTNASLLQNQAVIIDLISQLNIIVARTHDQKKATKLFATLRNSIEYMEPNYPISLDAIQERGIKFINDTGLQWGIQAIHAKEAWKFGMGENTIVAIADTGIYRHIDLYENFWRNPGESGNDVAGRDKSTNGLDDDSNGFIDDLIGWNFVASNNQPFDDHFHGTHIAGTVASIGGNGSGVTGVARKSKIMSLKFIGSDGLGKTDGAIRAILYASDAGAKVINCSWNSSGYSQALRDAIEYAKGKGTLVVASAGNNESDNDKSPHYPASYDNENLISVAATSTASHVLASFSNFGKTAVDLGAPGDSILSTFNPKYNQTNSPVRGEWYSALSGTSMAVPQVSGAIALLYSINPDLNWKQTKEIILSAVTHVKKLENKLLSGGVLNVAAAANKAFSMKH